MNPYLIFNGNAAEVIEFYKKTLGAKVEFMTSYGESPVTSTENWKDKVLHSTLTINDTMVMLADGPPEKKISMGNNIHLALDFKSDQAIEEAFKALSEGGEVTMPLQKTFYAKQFGMLVDKFGVHWMFNQD